MRLARWPCTTLVVNAVPPMSTRPTGRSSPRWNRLICCLLMVDTDGWKRHHSNWSGHLATRPLNRRSVVSDLFIEVPRTSTPKAIEDQIKGLIVSRQLIAGEALPAERHFAARLG